MKRVAVASGLFAALVLSVLQAAPGGDALGAKPVAGTKPALAQAASAGGQVTPAAPTASGTVAPSQLRPMMDRYCITCHNERLKTANLSLQTLDFAKLGESVEVGVTLEKVVRKLRVGAMPPAGAPRPDAATMQGFVTTIESELDRVAAAKPNPGRKETFHRLNRAEYRNTIRDILALEMDVSSLIPTDETSFGFDNIGGVLKLSPTFMERYSTAATKLSRLAVGSMSTPAAVSVTRLMSDINQDNYIDGMPLGSRGGLQTKHYFPLDAEYQIRTELLSSRSEDGRVKDYKTKHTIELSLDGGQLKAFTLGDKPIESRDDGLFTVRVAVKAGMHDVAAVFARKSSAEPPTLRDWFAVPFFGSVGEGGSDTLYQPQIGSLWVLGPFNPTGPGDTPSRRRIFTCRPTSSGDEARCARQIISTVARRAYRRPVADADINPLMEFFAQGRAGDEGTFDRGIEVALGRVLTSPQFLLRVERDPPSVAKGSNYRISDIELASRLSFFLWSSGPDDQLLDVAAAGKLKDPAILRQQVRRMLLDARSNELINNFAGQWLYLRNIPLLAVTQNQFPDFEAGLRLAFRRETELLLQDVFRNDKAKVLDLLRADYTYLNESLAKHYGVPDVYGPHFRKVSMAGVPRGGGLLSHGSILMATSYPNRTAPTIRGKWILSTLLGVPPPDPPPDVPALPETAVGLETEIVSVRTRLERHRANPTCASCHKLMDPLGLALENFNAVGQWRVKDEAGTTVDASSVLFDGTTVNNPLSLRDGLLKYSDSIVRNITERLLTYSLGRGVEHYDYPAIRKIVRDGGGSGASFTSIVEGIVTSVPFQMRRSES